MICRTRISVNIALLLAICLLLLIPIQAQNVPAKETQNLLLNPDANEYSSHWIPFGDATIENAAGHETCFSLRNQGSFHQDILLPPEAEGKYAVLLGLASSERINADGAITGLPYLYGYMMTDSVHIIAYLQGQQMWGSVKVPNEWWPLSGIFMVPPGTKMIRFFLNQAERKGVPQNGSAARFDDLGLYILPSKPEAELFVQDHFIRKEKVAATGFGQNQQFGGEHQFDLARYKAQFLGYMDEARTIQVYAMAKVNKSEEATVRSVPHQEAIAYGPQGEQWRVISKFEDSLWVCMTAVKFPPGPRILYFAVMYPSQHLRYFKYTPNTKKPIEEIAGEGDGNDAFAIIGLKAIAQRPPQ